MKKLFLLSILCLVVNAVSAVEGMWIPTLLKKYNMEEMQKMGFKLTAEDIYDVNHASLKDAVVLFGGGCTGELISGDGLLITNHHCGFGQIQKHSSVGHDYLTDGYWAKNRSDELSNPGLTVQFLVRMEDVTAEILKGVSNELDDKAGKQLILANTEAVKKALKGKSDLVVDVKPLFYGNQYFAYVYEVYKDIRLVGAPPVSIGKFGGDTDNWVWPRHTGDFSLFRIYAGKDNKPAAYSPDNVPYHPKKFFPINLKGTKEGDFTLVFGFPGSTQEYIPSQAVRLLMEKSNPAKVEVRTARLGILEKHMASDPKVRIQYASKYASIANSWKKWQGETRGLVRLNALEIKGREEKAFAGWMGEEAERTTKYGQLHADFEKNYAELSQYQVANDLYNEAILRGSDIINIISRVQLLALALNDTARFSKQKKAVADYLPGYLKDYDPATDEQVFCELLQLFLKRVDEKFLPQQLITQKSKFSDKTFLSSLYRKSMFSDSVKIRQLVTGFNARSVKKLKKDELYMLLTGITGTYTTSIEPVFQKITQSIQKTQKSYMAAILEMKKNQRLMADANLTLRVTYGKIEGYEPSDGVYYQYYTTLSGMIAKEDPAVEDYQVPTRLKMLHQQKDFGNYTNASGEVPIAFCASNHTTGGNSGSPVINANGELIGVNFDRCWEGTMSDVLFDPDHCRNIALDIRYALFIVDKFAGAGYLLDEMKLIR